MVRLSADGRAEAVVVGAGAAGLAAAAALRRQGIVPLVLDRGERVGASWRARYDGLRLNTDRAASALPFTALPASEPRWVPRDRFAAYLERYAREHQIVPRFGVAVARIEQDDAGWRVELDHGESVRTPIVVVATGSEHTPAIPDWPGREEYPGRFLHSSAYRNAAEFVGADVLVVGTGASGLEIASELVEAGARRVSVAMREAPHVFPRAICGVAMLPRGLTLLLRLPPRLADRVGGLLQRLVWGNCARHGFGPRPLGVATSLRTRGKGPVFDDRFLRLLRRGRCRIVAGVSGFDGASVLLDDGTSLEPDAVIAATGYRRGLEPVVGDLGVLDERGVPRICGAEDPAHPGLFFLGYVQPPLVHLAAGATAIAAAAARLPRAVTPQRAAMLRAR